VVFILYLPEDATAKVLLLRRFLKLQKILFEVTFIFKHLENFLNFLFVKKLLKRSSIPL